jgi:hypothetical protein
MTKHENSFLLVNWQVNAKPKVALGGLLRAFLRGVHGH